MTDIRDIKPLLTLEYPWPSVLLTAAGLGLILLGAYLWWRMRPHRPPEEIVPPPRSPYELALEALAALAADGLIEGGKTAEFYLRLSRALRELFEAVFGFPATGFTSRELLQALADQRISLHLIQMVEQFHRHCDFVKFTSLPAGRAEMQEALGRAQQLIEETRRQLEGQGPVAGPSPEGVRERVALR